MAIVNMKKLVLHAISSDKDEILKTIQKLQCVEVLESGISDTSVKENENNSPLSLQNELDKTRWALSRLSLYDTEKKPMFGMFKSISQDESKAVWSQKEELLSLIEEMEALEGKISEIRNAKNRIKLTREQLLYWKDLDIKKEDMVSLKTVEQLIGSISAKSYDDFIAALSPLPSFVQEISKNRDLVNIYIVYHKDSAAEIRSILETNGFVKDNIQLASGKTCAQCIEELNHEEAALPAKEQALLEEIKAYTIHIPKFKILHDLYQLHMSRDESNEKLIYTSKTFMLSGWVPEYAVDALEKSIKAVSPSCAISFTEPAEGEEPSVLLKNNPIVSAFEPVVEGFSMPRYRSLDPTAVMAPFYVCLFGMMVSDAGYGLIMALALFLFVKIKKIPLKNAKLLYLLMFGGIATVFWGIAFNTTLGFNLIPPLSNTFPLDPVTKPMPVMLLCIAVGAVHLLAGLVIAAYANIRKRDFVAAVSDQLSWFLLLAGLGLLISPALSKYGQIMALSGLIIILIMAGREHKNPFKRIFSGLGALYGITGWVSDLLSYMRLFGMGLATGVIGMVFNVLIGMVWSAGIIGKPIAVLLFVACHLFNLGINALGAYVHSCRLQYIEFFGKFFEDGGKAFKPLNNKTKYVSIQ